MRRGSREGTRSPVLDTFRKALNRRSPAEVTALCLVIAGFVGAIDYLTGYELSLSIFYLVPIGLVAWYARQWVGYALCVVFAIMWLVVDYTTGHAYSSWFKPVWNTVIRLGFFLLTTFLLSELRARLRHEETLARTDGLTQVFNTRAFKEISDRLLKLAARHRHPAVLAYIDVDDFKAVNDEKGHSAGDMVLQAAAETLLRCVRSTDVVGRLGGDEFAVFMPETDGAGARIAFARIYEGLVSGAAAVGVPVGFSIGVAVFPAAPPAVDEALEAADRLMYRVKRAGKNNVMYEEIAGDCAEAEHSAEADGAASRR